MAWLPAALPAALLLPIPFVHRGKLRRDRSCIEGAFERRRIDILLVVRRCKERTALGYPAVLCRGYALAPQV